MYVSLVCFFNPSKTLGCTHFSIFQEPENTEALYPISFLCPNGTIFNQEVFVCEWWSVFLFYSDFFYIYSARVGQSFYLIQIFLKNYSDFFIFIQLVVVIDEKSKPTNCIKYNRPSKYATKKGSNTPILQRWWWCVVKPIKFSILSPINHSTGWMVVITQMKKITKKYQMMKRRCVLCIKSLNIRILFPKCAEAAEEEFGKVGCWKPGLAEVRSTINVPTDAQTPTFFREQAALYQLPVIIS